MQKAMNQSNFYLWGGTVAPNYDCSGLVQAAFASIGVWLPRDSYQQESFTQKIGQEELQTGDLIFFGQEKVNHVALYLGNLDYIHSSGKELGNNGIGINKLSDQGNKVNRNYSEIVWSFGRVMSSYQPSGGMQN
jgi:cell wall-associated NlpC family hydrolase